LQEEWGGSKRLLSLPPYDKDSLTGAESFKDGGSWSLMMTCRPSGYSLSVCFKDVANKQVLLQNLIDTMTKSNFLEYIPIGKIYFATHILSKLKII
jgi:hypothetical protein